MTISERLLPEYDQEMAGVRKTLERVPDDKLSWKPHDKSMSMQQLASHIANLPNWTVLSLKQDQFDMNPPDGEPATTPQANSQQELLEFFDKNSTAARAAIAAAADEDFRKDWSLLSGGHTFFTMPKIAVYRLFVMNHIIHHRAQLGVYLRLNDVAVPALYGPSADEQGM